jgi:hypothetical protein
MILRIQPDEGIALEFAAKRPGPFERAYERQKPIGPHRTHCLAPGGACCIGAFRCVPLSWIATRLTPSESENAPGLQGLSHAGVTRSRRRRMISAVKPDEPAANFQRRDNARPMDGAELRILAQLDAKQKGRQTKRRLNIRQHGVTTNE